MLLIIIQYHSMYYLPFTIIQYTTCHSTSFNILHVIHCQSVSFNISWVPLSFFGFHSTARYFGRCPLTLWCTLRRDPFRFLMKHLDHSILQVSSNILFYYHSNSNHSINNHSSKVHVFNHHSRSIKSFNPI